MYPRPGSWCCLKFATLNAYISESIRGRKILWHIDDDESDSQADV